MRFSSPQGSLGPEDVAVLLAPFVQSPAPELWQQLAVYLALLLKWNERTNLTAIRDPREIVLRHFGESLLAAEMTGEMKTLLDFGSGAGFPGLPIALQRKEITVTLAESQQKKNSFLREAVRALGIPVEVWPHRVETMGLRRFECVALRAVDRMESALVDASGRASHTLIVLTTVSRSEGIEKLTGFVEVHRRVVPASEERLILRLDRADVPHGT